MKKVIRLIQFELKRRVFSWLTLVFLGILIFQAIWYTKGSFDYYVNANIFMNSPVIIYRNFAGMGMLMVVIIAIISGAVIWQEKQHKTAHWFYSFPIKDKAFYIGKFATTYFYLLFISIGLIIGNLLLPYVGIGEAHRFRSTPLAEIFHAVFIYLVPNIFIYVSVIFSTIVFTRRQSVGYLACFTLVLIYIFSQVSYDSSQTSWLVFTDPSGYVSVQHYYAQVPTEVKNNGLMSVTGFVLINRLIWIGIALVLFVLGYKKFSFKYFLVTKMKHKNKGIEHKNTLIPSEISIPKVGKQFHLQNQLGQLFRLTKSELLTMMRGSSFKIIIAVTLFLVILQNLFVNSTYYIGNTVPLASNMTIFRLMYGVFITLLIMMWAGELFFKDERFNIWQITDALPIPVWVRVLSRFVAICALSFILCCTFIIVGMLCQIFLGYPELIDIGRYAQDLLSYHWGFVNFALQAALVLCIAGISGNRFFTHAIAIGIYLFFIISFELEVLTELRYGYGLTPGVEDYSEMSGYGIFNLSAAWFAMTWAVLAAAFVLLGVWFWQRGTKLPLSTRFKSTQLSSLGKIMTFVFILLFIGCQWYLHQNIYANGNYIGPEEEEHKAATYERQYAHLQNQNTVKYTAIEASIDLYPEKRRLDYTANIALKVPPIDTLYFNIKDFVHIQSIAWNGVPKDLIYKDDVQHVYGILIKNETTSTQNYFKIKAYKQYHGLAQSDVKADLTPQSPYASFRDFMPTFGYDSDRELTENRQRQDKHLPELSSRMAKVTDVVALDQLARSTDAEKITAKIKISVPKGQIPIAPGVLLHQKEEDGRGIYQYEVQQPTAFNWYVGCANYQKFVDKDYKGTHYRILAHPQHDFNISTYEEATKKAIDYVKARFPSFSLTQLAIAEKHSWGETNLDAFANHIIIGEKQGWFADVSHLEEKAFIYQTLASQMISLWVNDHLHIANVQGAEMLHTALPEALALGFVKQELGEEALQHIIDKKQDKYDKGRFNEPNTEPPLIYADDIDYLEYNKGAIAMYHLINIVGEKEFFQILKSFKNTDDYITFKQVYQQCLKKIPKNQVQNIRRKFETVE